MTWAFMVMECVKLTSQLPDPAIVMDDVIPRLLFQQRPIPRVIIELQFEIGVLLRVEGQEDVVDPPARLGVHPIGKTLPSLVVSRQFVSEREAIELWVLRHVCVYGHGRLEPGLVLETVCWDIDGQE